MRCHHRRAAELLHALPPDGDARDGEERVYTSAAPIAWDELSRGHTEDDDDTYLFAKALFDAREFARCAHVLDAAFGAEPAGVRRPYPSKPLFLRCYALYLVRPARAVLRQSSPARRSLATAGPTPPLPPARA